MNDIGAFGRHRASLLLGSAAFKRTLCHAASAWARPASLLALAMLCPALALLALLLCTIWPANASNAASDARAYAPAAGVGSSGWAGGLSAWEVWARRDCGIRGAANVLERRDRCAGPPALALGASGAARILVSSPLLL